MQFGDLHLERKGPKPLFIFLHLPATERQFKYPPLRYFNSLLNILNFLQFLHINLKRIKKKKNTTSATDVRIVLLHKKDMLIISF